MYLAILCPNCTNTYHVVVQATPFLVPFIAGALHAQNTHKEPRDLGAQIETKFRKRG